jgi:hypothetical protein
MSRRTLRRYATRLLATLSFAMLCTSIPAFAQTVTGEVYIGNGTYPSNDDTDYYSQQNPAVAVNPTTNRIYINRALEWGNAGNAVTEVNGSDNSIIREIPLPVDSHGIAINTNTNRLYLPTYTWNAVMVYDVTAGTMEVVPIPFDERDEPCRVMGEVAVDQNSNRIYITCWRGRVAVMNGADNSMQFITAPPLLGSGNDYYGVAADPANNRAFIVGLAFNGIGGGSAWAIDILDANNNVTRVRAPATMDLGGSIAFNPATNRLYLTAVDRTNLEDWWSGGKPGVLVMNGADHSFSFVQIPFPTDVHWDGYRRTSSVGVNSTTNRVYVTHDDYTNPETLKLITLDGFTHAVTEVSFPERPGGPYYHYGWGYRREPGNRPSLPPHSSIATGRVPGVKRSRTLGRWLGGGHC